MGAMSRQLTDRCIAGGHGPVGQRPRLVARIGDETRFPGISQGTHKLRR
jgi:hypothetical protein